MLILTLEFPEGFDSFDLDKELNRIAKRNNLLSLYVIYPELKKFPNSIFNLTTRDRFRNVLKSSL